MKFSSKELEELLRQLPSKVVGAVPWGTEKGHFNPREWDGGDSKRVAPFVMYALAAASEALEDAKWTVRSIYRSSLCRSLASQPLCVDDSLKHWRHGEERG